MNKNEGMRPRHILIILAFICIVLIIISSLSSSANNVVRGGLNTIFMPMQKGLNFLGGSISNRAEEIARLQEIEEDYAKLKEEVDYLRTQNTQYRLQLDELAEYRNLLAMKEEYPDYPTIGAHVIGENSTNWNKTVLIDRGENDGIKVDMNVISQGGLVGIVTSVTANSATVRTIADHGCQVSGMSLLTEDTCIIKGDLSLYDAGKLILEKINKDAQVQNDYKIVTSNKSSVYLPGILIGYTQDLEIDSNNLTKSGYLIPVVDFTHLDSVLVITQLKETGEN